MKEDNQKVAKLEEEMDKSSTTCERPTPFPHTITTSALLLRSKCCGWLDLGVELDSDVGDRNILCQEETLGGRDEAGQGQ